MKPQIFVADDDEMIAASIRRALSRRSGDVRSDRSISQEPVRCSTCGRSLAFRLKTTGDTLMRSGLTHTSQITSLIRKVAEQPRFV